MSYLSIYLNDHLAGATAGFELAKRTLRSNGGTEFELPLSKLRDEIAEDRETLEALMEQLGVPRRSWKVTGAFLAEKVARLKLNGELVGYSPLSRVVELEALQLGVEGKAAMWRALRDLADSDKRIDGQKMARLERRAGNQRRRIEELRVAAARIAFSGASGSSA